MSIEPLKVDVEKVLIEKSAGGKHRLPRFIISYLKRIIHQDEINEFLKIHGDKYGQDFTNAALTYMNLKVNVVGFDKIPHDQRYTFASNHPLGGLDGIALLNLIALRYKNVKALSNDILMNIQNLSPFFIPINKHGGQSKAFIENINNTYNSDTPIAIFPAGLVSRRTNGVIEDVEWTKSFITKSVQFKRDIVPVHISGRVSNFFYNLANLRKLLRVKTNIEMLYLPNEMFKFKNKEITITFGEPVSYTKFTKDKSAVEWAKYIKEKVYKLA